MSNEATKSWIEFERRANKCLEEDSKLSKHSRSIDPSHTDPDSVWNKNRARTWTIGRMDLKNSLHRKDRKNQCQIMTATDNKDDVICNAISDDITMLFDPCVAERLWRTRNGEDQKFLKALGTAISSYKSRFIKKQNRDNGHDTRFLRLFVKELNRRGQFDLEGSDWEDCVSKSCGHRKNNPNCLRDLPREEYIREQYKKVLELIKQLVEQDTPITDILRLTYLRDAGKFQKRCEAWFRDDKSSHEDDYRPWD